MPKKKVHENDDTSPELSNFIEGKSTCDKVLFDDKNPGTGTRKCSEHPQISSERPW